MSDHEPARDRTKQPARATAGPSADDRYGPGPIAENVSSRILGVHVIGGRTRITMARGKTHGIHAAMEGYIKAPGGMLADFQIDAADNARCHAFVDSITPDQLRDHLAVMLNPTSKPKGRTTAATPTRVIHVSVEDSKTKIVFPRGTMHGVTADMEAHLVADNGREGASFKVAYTTAMLSFAYITNTVDHVHAHPKVVFNSPSHAAAIQRRASGAAATANVQSTAAAGVAGASSPLPHLATIQRAFGKHDVSNIRAQVGGPATAAADALGAQAYATGDTVAFASAPDLHTAAHEAAHTIQQRHGAVGFQGLGAADDEHERHADAVADAVVAGQSAEPLLDEVASGGSATTAVQRKEKPNESAEHKEPSWIRPSSNASETAEHVGSIYFKTKQAAVDARDRELFGELARSYSAYAKRNLGQHGKPLGLTGRVVGYADPRGSASPSNQELSDERAHAVASGVERALASTTRLEIGNFALKRIGAGIDPDAASITSEPLAEGNTLAPFRRADIFIHRSAGPDPSSDRTQETPTKTRHEGTRLQQAPDIRTGYDQWRPYILEGNKDIIEGVAAHILGAIDGGFLSQRYNDILSLDIGGGAEPPPWWNERDAAFAQVLNPPSMGRSVRRNQEQADKARLAYATLLLLRDYEEIVYFEENHFHRARLVVRRDVPSDPHERAEAQRTLRFMLFMIHETKKLGKAVLRAVN